MTYTNRTLFTGLRSLNSRLSIAFAFALVDPCLTGKYGSTVLAKFLNNTYWRIYLFTVLAIAIFAGI